MKAQGEFGRTDSVVLSGKNVKKIYSKLKYLVAGCKLFCCVRFSIFQLLVKLLVIADNRQLCK